MPTATDWVPRALRVSAVSAVLAGAGALWLVPDAASRLRRQLMPYAAQEPDCVVSDGPCTATFDDGEAVTLRLEPSPPVANAPLTLHVRATEALQARAVEIQGVSMNMGLVHLPLAETPEPGVYRATGALPACTSQEMQWRADVLLEGRLAGFQWTTRQGEAVAPPARPPERAASSATYGDFTVETAEGPLSLSSLRGRPVVVYFGYTSCPDICPMTLATVQAAFAGLPEAAGVRSHATALLVSVDPARDTPEKLARYVAFFAEPGQGRFIGGTAAPEALDAIADDWGVTFRRVDAPASALPYTMDHSTQAYLVAPSGEMARTLPHGMPVEDMTAAILESVTP